MVRKNIKQIFSVARVEYLNWLTNPRLIILPILLIFMKTLAIDPLSARAEKFGEKLIVFEPFIAVGNSGMLAMLIPAVFLVLLSDYPRLHGNTMFFISRTGKRNWLCGQIVFLLMAIVSFMIMVFWLSILLSGGRFAWSWSNAVTKYNSRFPNEMNSFDSQLLPSNLYNQIPMMKAVVQTFVLMSAFLFTISLLVYLFKILFNNSSGLAAGLVMIACGVLTTSLYSKLRWIFPTANTIVWLHYDEILEKPIYPVWCSFAYFGILTITLLALDFLALKRIKVTENNES